MVKWLRHWTSNGWMSLNCSRAKQNLFLYMIENIKQIFINKEMFTQFLFLFFYLPLQFDILKILFIILLIIFS